MASQAALRTAVFFTGVCCLSLKVTTKEFDCCKLPINISVDRSQESEFSVGNESKVIVSEKIFNATPPFETNGDKLVTLDQCLDFYQKIIYLNEKGKTEERHIYHQSKTCDRTTTTTTTATPITTPPHNHTGLIIGIVSPLVVIVVIGIIAIIIYCFEKSPPREWLRGRRESIEMV